MTRRNAAALVIGIFFTAITALLSKHLSIFSLVWAPGLLRAALLTSGAAPSAIAILAYSALVYSALALAVLARWPSIDARSSAIIKVMVIPTLAAGILACIPGLNPILPQGMEELRRLEWALQRGLAIGLPSIRVRDTLGSFSPGFSERIQATRGIVVDNGNLLATAEAGDRVFEAVIPGRAFEFPCHYDIKIIVVVGADDTVKQRYLDRTKRCI